jgi:hypothetical protein
MRTGLSKRLREALREHGEGLTARELSFKLAANTKAITRRLHEMPDTYIDRWLATTGPYAAVWCVVVPPPNCPRPTGKD